MFVFNPITLEFEWVPRGMCFAEDGSEDGGGGEGGGEEGGEEGQQTQSGGEGTNTLLAGNEDQIQLAPDWRATIEDADLRKLADRYESPTAIAKAVSDMRAETSTRIKPLGENATDEEITTYRNLMGVPKTAEEYVFKTPEGVDATDADKAFQGEMAKAMHGANVTAGQAEALTAAFNDYAVQTQAMQEKLSTEATQKAVEALDREWGGDSDRNKELARRTVAEFGGEEFTAFLEEKKVDGISLGDHPAFLKAFTKIGRRSAEAGIEMELPAGERATLDEAITAKRAEIQQAIDKGDHKRAQQLDREERDLWARTGNNQTIGAGGVAVAQ